MRSAIIVVAMICAAGPVAAQSFEDAKMDEIQATPQPEQQKDLDTFKLASAHRERAETVREKTNGLWQSWLVSICEGCGPERQPYFKRERTQVSEGARSNVVAAQKPTVAAPKTVAVVAKPPKPAMHASLVADLSPSNIDQIRRMPR